MRHACSGMFRHARAEADVTKSEGEGEGDGESEGGSCAATLALLTPALLITYAIRRFNR